MRKFILAALTAFKPVTINVTVTAERNADPRAVADKVVAKLDNLARFPMSNRRGQVS